ncbi:MAG: type II secretion system F family protein [Coriobacteriales bacterium]|jgi:tight adherence protein B
MAAGSALLLIAALASSGVCAFNLVRCLLQLFCSWGPWNRAALRTALSRALDVVARVHVIERMSKRAQARRRAAAFEQAMPEALRLLSVALDSGSSLVHALEYTADNCDEPLASELKRTVWDLQAGQGFDEAMEGLRSRTGGTEFSYLAVAMEIQHRAGSSMGRVLGTVSEQLKRSRKLSDELKTKTAQGRLSARIVVALPLLVLAVVSLFSPGYLAVFFTSPLGAFLLVVACLLEALGIVMLRRILSPDLSRRTGGAWK